MRGLFQQAHGVIQLASRIFKLAEPPKYFAQIVMGHDEAHVEEKCLAIFTDRFGTLAAKIMDQAAQKVGICPQIVKLQCATAACQRGIVLSPVGADEALTDQGSDMIWIGGEDCSIFLRRCFKIFAIEIEIGFT